MEKPEDVYRCFDCLKRVNLYMVTDRVWDTAWPHHQQHHKVMLKEAEDTDLTMEVATWMMAQKSKRKALVRQLLCFDCLAIRLGRPLVIDDFTATHCNKTIRLGFQMAMATLGPSYLSTEPPIRG
jgi:hypothetical protein